MNKYLLVKGCAGIGNRLFTLAAAIKYANNTNRKIIVDWRDGVFAEPTKNAFDIFYSLDNTLIGTLDEVNMSKEAFTYYPSSLKNALDECLYKNYMAAASKNIIKLPGITKVGGRLSRLAEFWCYAPGNNFGKQIYSDSEAVKALFSNTSVEYGHKLSIRLKHDVVLFADYWPGEIDEKYFEKIKIKQDLKQKIEQTKHQIGITNETIGVHIRNTDKRPTKEIDVLIKKLENKINGSSNIFLATDDYEVEKKIKNIFNDKLITLPKFYPDDKADANMHHNALRSGEYKQAEKIYEECLIDIYLLANCSALYYQGNSSFSRLAKVYHANKKNCYDWLKL